jgi:ubiquinone/menaquinone biosynthesis C-methylase UbiE
MSRAMRGPSRAFFDAWARIYDFPLVQLATYRPVHTAVLAALRARPDARVLDVGCGTGQLGARIVEALPATRVVGCDFSAGMLERAAQRFAPGSRPPPHAARGESHAHGHVARRGAHLPAVSLVRGDALRLPFRTGAFDAVVSTEAFHWFPDQDAALREFFRVLAPGGSLLLALVAPPLALVSAVVHLGSRLVGEPLYWPTATAMRARVEAAGFRVETQRRIFRLPGFLLLPVLTAARRPGDGGRRASSRSHS